jgi:sugar lactone lactonase YvrE
LNKTVFSKRELGRYKIVYVLLVSILTLSLYPYQHSEAFVSGQFSTTSLGSTDLENVIYKLGLHSPQDVAIDSSGNVWVVDTNDNRILKYDGPVSSMTTNQAPSVVLGQPNVISVISNNGGISDRTLNLPQTIAIDSSGNLWVADTGNNRVLKYTGPDNSITTGQAASLVLGQAGFGTGLPGTTATTLNSPEGIAIDSLGNVYVGDRVNNRVLQYLSPISNGQAASHVLGQAGFGTGLPGTTATTLNSPEGIVIDSSGNVFVADFFNNRVLQYTGPASSISNGQAASLVLGQATFTTNTAGTTSTTLSNPRCMAFDPSGNLWVADGTNNRVLKYASPISTGQAASLVLGQPNLTTGTINTGGLSASSFKFPQGIAFDPSGNLWVVDRNDHRVLEFATPSSTGQAASLVLGQPNFASAIANNGGVSSSTLVYPRGIAFDPSGNLWVVDRNNNRVLKFVGPASSITTGQAASVVLGQPDFVTNTIGTTNAKLNFPTDIAIDSSGNIWVTDTGNNRVLEFATPSSTGQAASLVLGQPNLTTGTINTGGLSASSLNSPEGIAIDSLGNILVADSANNRILNFSSPSLNGQAAAHVLGQTLFTTNTVGTTSTTLSSPQGVAIDSSGNIWVTDTSNNRVLKYPSHSSDGQAANLVLGQATFTTNTVGTTSTTLSSPQGIKIDSLGNVLVVDSANNRILNFSSPFSNGQTASHVLGQPNLTTGTTNTGGPSASSLNSPEGIAIDFSGNVWIADGNNNRVIKYPNEPGTTFVSPNLLVSGSNIDTLDKLIVNFAVPFVFTDTNLNIQTMIANPQTTNPPGTVVGSYYEIQTNAPDIILPPRNVTISYTTSQLTTAGVGEVTLHINRFSGGVWSVLLPTTIDLVHHKATAVSPGFSTFVLTGSPPTLLLSPSSGAANDTITVSGSNYSPGSSITITFDGNPISISTADAGGSFSTSVIIPPSTTVGVHTIAADDGVNIINKLFTVTGTSGGGGGGGGSGGGGSTSPPQTISSNDANLAAWKALAGQHGGGHPAGTGHGGQNQTLILNMISYDKIQNQMKIIVTSTLQPIKVEIQSTSGKYSPSLDAIQPYANENTFVFSAPLPQVNSTTVFISNLERSLSYSIDLKKPSDVKIITMPVHGTLLEKMMSPIQNTQNVTNPIQNIQQSAMISNLPQIPSTSDTLSVIKDWAGYSLHPISNKQFLSEMGVTAEFVPNWVSKTAKFVVDGDITPQDLQNAVKYLASHGIVK